MVTHDTAFPEHRKHSTSRVSNIEALSLISQYLEKAENDSSLHPNTQLTENGPIVPFSNAATGLVLHNLKRLEAGLKGEHIMADADLGHVANGLTILPKEADVAAGKDAERHGNMQLDWQDMSEFEQEQQELEGDIGPRTTGLGMVDEDEEPKVLEFQNTNESRLARKREKKHRRTEQRRKREREKMVNGVEDA